MTLDELHHLAAQASGDGVFVDVLRDAGQDAAVVRVRRRNPRTDEWMVTKRAFAAEQLRDEKCPGLVRAAICDMAAALVHAEMGLRLQPAPKPEPSRIVTLSS